MDTLQQLRSELEEEYHTTKKFFERYPAEQGHYTPHEKSMTQSRLAGHIAEVFGWASFILPTETLDFATGNYQPAAIGSKEQLLAELDKNYNASKEALENVAEDALLPNWSIAQNGHKLAEWSKYGAIRHSLNQIAHHRAQLGVYYRLQNIPLPGSYGPSADDQRFA